MLRLKKAARPRTELKKHNNQDIRVTVGNQDSKKDRGKGNRVKRLREVIEAFVIRQILVDIWENRLEYWELARDKAVKLIEVLTS